AARAAVEAAGGRVELLEAPAGDDAEAADAVAEALPSPDAASDADAASDEE
ncbi:MAG: hypothetical protein JWL78_884, partial [Chloroflexi bacterium]|nr:hypothetical protein [Chloroflexota bacterium]